MKSTRVPDPTKTFEEAIQQKYLKETDESTLFIRISATKVVETYGADIIKEHLSHLNKLETAFLLKMQINEIVTNDLNLSSLKHLNIGYNLFTSVNYIAQLCSRLPKLELLVLNGNRFSDFSINSDPIPQVNEISLSNTLTDSSNLRTWSELFVNIKTLTLAYNNFRQGDQLDFKPFSKLQVLDLSYNELESIPTDLPNTIESCIFSHNNLGILSQRVSFPSVSTLDLSYNNITSWKTVDSLHVIFPNLKELRLNSNDLPTKVGASADEIEQLQFIFILARWGGDKNLLKLNGMTITSQEQMDAELYFIRQVSSGNISYDKNSTRWKRYTEQYGSSATDAILEKKETLNSKLLELNVVLNDDTKIIKALKTATVQKLKAMIARSFKIVGILPQNLVLTYEDRQSSQKFELDDDIQALSYYNINSKTSVIYVTI